MCPVGPAAAPADRKVPGTVSGSKHGRLSPFEIYHKPRAKADRLPSFSASFWESPHPKLETPCHERAAVAARSPPRATQSASACHSARRTVRPVHPRLRDRALRVAAARRDPAADAEIAM